MNKITYLATLRFEEGEFILYPNAFVRHTSGRQVHRIVLSNLAEQDTGIPVTKYYEALAGNAVDVQYHDRNPLHSLGTIKIK